MTVPGYKKLEEKSFVVKDNISGYDKKFIKKVFRLPNGIIESFFVDDNKDSVQVFAITKDNKVVLVRQFRPGTEKDELELPGGGLDRPDEDPIVAGRRELREESGFVANEQQDDSDIVYLGYLPYSPYSTGKKHMVGIRNCERNFDLELDDNEFLKVYLADLDSFIELLKENKIRGTDTAFLAMMQFGLLNK